MLIATGVSLLLVPLSEHSQESYVCIQTRVYINIYTYFYIYLKGVPGRISHMGLQVASPHQQAVEFNSILTLSVYPEIAQIPQVKGSVPQEYPPLQTPVISPEPLAINQRFPHTPPWVQLICYKGSQFRKPIYVLDYQFITENILKDMNQHPNEEMHRLKSQTKELLFSWSFGAQHNGTWKLSGSPTWKLSNKDDNELSLWVSWRLHYIVMIH